MMRFLFMCCLLWLPLQTDAHEMRPGYLSMQETAPGQFSVLWKVPASGDQRLGLYVHLPAACASTGDPVRAIEAAAYTERWTVICAPGLNGQSIQIEGLQATMTDVLARIAYMDGSVEITRVVPDVPKFTVKGAQGSWQIAGTYFLLGVDHILSGFDHLVFVLALILLIHDQWMLLKTITAFTVAHSITLAGATLGLFSLPQKPVEAAIALSITFLAVELVKAKPGQPRSSEQYPWLVAFAFGLLHGFGFAGALQETGLPQSDIPMALLTFNLGVEAGQLLFVAAVLLVLRGLGTLLPDPMPKLRPIAAYGIGTVSMMWLLSRLASFGGT